MAKFGNRLSGMGRKWSMNVSLPLLAIGAASLKMAADFDDALVRMTSLVGIAREQVQAWRGDIRELAKDTGRSATELAEAMFFITSAGARGKMAMDILKASAQAAKIGLGDTKSVALAATSAVNAFGEASLSAEDAVATLVVTVREGNLEAASLAPVLGRVMGIASELGVEFHEVGAAMAAMPRLGTNAEESATSLRATLASIMKPSQQAEKALHKMGISFVDLRRQLREEGLIAVLTRLKEVMKDNEKGMAEIFPNIRALSGVLNMVGKNAASTQKIFASLAKTTGEDLKKAAEEAEKSFKVRMAKSLQEFADVLQELGEELLPVVVPLIEDLGRAAGYVVENWRELPPIIKQTAFALGALAIAAGPGMMVLGQMAKMLPTLMKGYRSLLLMEIGVMGQFTMVSKPAIMALTTLSGAASVFGAAIAGWMLGRVISDLTGITKKFAEMKEPLDVMAEAFDKNKGLVATTVLSLNRMADSLGMVGAQAALMQAMARGDTKAIAYWQSEILKASHANVETHERLRAEMQKEQEIAGRVVGAEERKLSAVEQVRRAKARMFQEEDERTRKAMEDARKGLLTQGEVEQAIRAQIDSWKQLQAEGIHMNQIVGKQGAKMEELLGMAEDYGVTLPLGLDEMVKTLKTEGHAELAKALDAFDAINASIDMTPGKIIAGFEKAGEAVEAQLRGGMERGVNEGMNVIKAKMDELQEYAEDNPIVWPTELESPTPPDGGRVP